MTFTKIYKITSKTNPEKVYDSTTSFWADHSDVVTDTKDLNATYKASGKLISTTGILAGDGLSINYEKIYKDEASFNEFEIEADSAMDTEAGKLDFVEV